MMIIKEISSNHHHLPVSNFAIESKSVSNYVELNFKSISKPQSKGYPIGRMIVLEVVCFLYYFLF